MKRLTATGERFGTRVYNDDGTEIKGIIAVTYRDSMKGQPILEVEILCKVAPTGDRAVKREDDGKMVDVSAPRLVVYVSNPSTGEVNRVRSITFEDGTVWNKEAQK